MASSAARLARVCASCGLPEPEGVTFPQCALCFELKLTSTLYCSPECQKNHWPEHKVWHQKQKEVAKHTEKDDVWFVVQGKVRPSGKLAGSCFLPLIEINAERMCG